MQISELAKRVGVTAHAVRHYESLGLLVARRRPSGYREFDEGAVRELRFITMSRQCGFSLKQIAAVLPDYRSGVLTAADMIGMLQARIAEVDAEIDKRQVLRAHLVAHIGWFEAREQRRADKAAQGGRGFPRAPREASLAAKGRAAGPDDKKVSTRSRRQGP
ncbi:MerR family transcriptional regulator [Cupriavidus sp. USMAHM13]|uniref:MerR family transcriptional regulator n=1 Tax=Cupriavidus sp. USMAHM13 TaxID=1389192 RepID=UPI0008A6D987|nr:MerR family transcriptional regulator [Cupriavidus sp. USMAHM13]AOZ03366.1 MerR family transcriptional regulator [Cupriavidus sp. USMAHM13]